MSRFENILLQASTWLSAASGLAFLLMKYLMENDDPFSVLGHPWQPHMLAVHLLVGPVVVFALGLISRDHVLDRYINGNGRGGRRSGTSTILLAAPMILSGYCLQIVTDESLHRLLVILHVASGLLFLLLFVLHLRGAAARRRKAASVLPGAGNVPAP
jgi:hypothetical protein